MLAVLHHERNTVLIRAHMVVQPAFQVDLPLADVLLLRRFQCKVGDMNRLDQLLHHALVLVQLLGHRRHAALRAFLDGLESDKQLIARLLILRGQLPDCALLPIQPVRHGRDPRIRAVLDAPEAREKLLARRPVIPLLRRRRGRALLGLPVAAVQPISDRRDPGVHVLLELPHARGQLRTRLLLLLVLRGDLAGLAVQPLGDHP